MSRTFPPQTPPKLIFTIIYVIKEFQERVKHQQLHNINQYLHPLVNPQMGPMLTVNLQSQQDTHLFRRWSSVATKSRVTTVSRQPEPWAWKYWQLTADSSARFWDRVWWSLQCSPQRCHQHLISLKKTNKRHKLFYRKWVHQYVQARLSPHNQQQLQEPQQWYIDTSTKKPCIVIWTQLIVDTEGKNRHWNCQEETPWFLLVDSSH